MRKLYENTLENMMVDLENSMLGNIETDMSEDIDTQTSKAENKLLDMVEQKNKIEADDLLVHIAYLNKTKAYECGFRRAMFIMLDTLLGGNMKSIGIDGTDK